MTATAQHALSKMFEPKSIAVIGASKDSKKIGYIVTNNLVSSDYKGEIYPVNPKENEILGKKCYASVKDIGEEVELAIISVPSTVVMDVMEDIAETEIKNVVMYTAGFKETGSEGESLEEDLARFCEDNNINLLGPNCLGYLNNEKSINATFAKVSNKLGKLKFLSQSGALASGIFDWSDHSGLGFKEFITLGNKAVLNENDILSYWYKNDLKHDEVIGMYLESISNGEEFVRLCSLITLDHPTFLLKPGKSDGAKKAMQSHTGSLAGEDYVLDAALKKAGVIRCDGINDLFDLSKVFSWCYLPEGPNVAVVSNAGGPAVISADLISEYGLELAQLSEKSQKYLTEHLPRAASLLNPIDVLGDAMSDRYKYALDAVLEDKNIDSVVVIMTPQLMTEIEKTASAISDLVEIHNKPVVCALIGGTEVAKGESILNKHEIPSFVYPERAIRAIAHMWNYKNNVDERLADKDSVVSLLGDTHELNVDQKITYVQGIISEAKDARGGSGMVGSLVESSMVLTSTEVDNIFKVFDIRTPPSIEITTVMEGLGFAESHSWPVVMKLSSPEALHKKELGGVITNISSEKELEGAFDDLVDRSQGLKDCAIQVQKQIQDGIEVLVGVKRDPTFGNILMFGAGGTFTELIADRNIALLPIDKKTIKQLIESSKVYELLKGYRGDQPYDIDSLVELIYKLGLLVDSMQIFSEIEINPVIVTKTNSYAVDGKAIIFEK